MRFIHLADLHIGKKVNGFSMLEDQRYVLEQVLEVAAGQRLDGVLLAGDIYDKSVPSGEAVQLFDWFLTELSRLNLPVYMVSGNHDSGERLSFGARLLERSDIYVSSMYDGQLSVIRLEDAYGPLNLYLLPFVKPLHVRKALDLSKGEGEVQEELLEDLEEVTTYDDAIRSVLAQAFVDEKERNLLVAHQFVTGASRCESEDISIGGLDNISADLFRDFDYVALGHIHGPQSLTRESIRYSGTLLKYSFSECRHKKSITIVELKGKGEVSIETIPVRPLHDMRILEGDYDTLMSPDFCEKEKRQDYIRVVLTDEREIPEVIGKLRGLYPNIMEVEYKNFKRVIISRLQEGQVAEQKNPVDYVRDFYHLQQGKDMDTEQEMIVLELMKEIWGE